MTYCRVSRQAARGSAGAIDDISSELATPPGRRHAVVNITTYAWPILHGSFFSSKPDKWPRVEFFSTISISRSWASRRCSRAFPCRRRHYSPPYSPARRQPASRTRPRASDCSFSQISISAHRAVILPASRACLISPDSRRQGRRIACCSASSPDRREYHAGHHGLYYHDADGASPRPLIITYGSASLPSLCLMVEVDALEHFSRHFAQI